MSSTPKSSTKVEALNGRLDSSGRCLEALDMFLAEQTDANGQRLAAAYNDIPKHRRRYILSDMDAKDGPLRVLTTPVGTKLAGRVVTADRRAQALRYFAERQASRQKAAERTPPVAPAVVVPGSFHHQGWPDPPGILALHTQYPAPVRIGDVIYPTVEHAYWALRTTDRAIRDAVLAEPNTYGLSRIASESLARPGWDASLQATIAQLLRAKFQQHEALAEELRATGEGRIVSTPPGSATPTRTAAGATSSADSSNSSALSSNPGGPGSSTWGRSISWAWPLSARPSWRAELDSGSLRMRYRWAGLLVHSRLVPPRSTRC